MAYAVISSLLESFEQALGRRFRWRGSDRLRVFPHAFRGRNARFVPDMDGSLQFGYFRADERDPGRNLPGQHVFTCLSHDILMHEAAHALVHRQRARFKDPTNLDVYAFHEGFADIVALFQHFTMPGLVNRYIQENRADLTAVRPRHLSLRVMFSMVAMWSQFRAVVARPGVWQHVALLAPLW